MDRDPHARAARRIWGGEHDSLPLRLRLMRGTFRRLGPIAPALLARYAFSLWFRTYRFPEPARERRLRARAEPVLLDLAGRSVDAYAWGEGPTVLLIHGWNGRGTQLGAFVDPLLEQGLRIVAFDAPAHGRTAGESTDVFEIAAAIGRLAEREGPFRGAIAHSLGTLGLVIALADGVPVERVVSLSPPGGLDTLLAKFAAILALPPPVVDELRRMLEAFIGEDFWARLDRIVPPPALVIHDRDDGQIPWWEGREVAERWLGARFVLTEGLGHRRVLRNRDVVARAVEFIAAADPA